MTDSTRWLSAQEEDLWRTWLTVHADLSASLQRRMQEGSQLSMADYGVLVHLTEQPDQSGQPGESGQPGQPGQSGESGDRMRASDLAGAMQWDASRLSHHVRRMESRGLVERVQCPEDRRGSFVGATDAGRQAIADAAPDHVDAVRRHFLAGLDEGDRETLAGLLAKLRAHLDER